MSPTLLGHLANIMFGVAYAVKDMLWLRLLSVVGCSLCAGFNYWAPASPLWTAIFWNTIFTSVNLIAAWRTWAQRRNAREAALQ